MTQLVVALFLAQATPAPIPRNYHFLCNFVQRGKGDVPPELRHCLLERSWHDWPPDRMKIEPQIG
jgi:hypothetical protein